MVAKKHKICKDLQKKKYLQSSFFFFGFHPTNLLLIIMTKEVVSTSCQGMQNDDYQSRSFHLLIIISYISKNIFFISHLSLNQLHHIITVHLNMMLNAFIGKYSNFYSQEKKHLQIEKVECDYF